MDDILTFEADNELDWFTNLEFENIFASVNNLNGQCSDKLAKRRGKTAKQTQQRKQTESDMNAWKRRSSSIGKKIFHLYPFTFFVNRTCWLIFNSLKIKLKQINFFFLLKNLFFNKIQNC